MESETAEKVRARRIQRILVGLTFLLIAIPPVIFWLAQNRN